MAQRPQADILYLIRARLDSGRDKGAPQLNKDIRVLKRAETEIVALRKEVDRLKELLPSNAQITGDAGLPAASGAAQC